MLSQCLIVQLVVLSSGLVSWVLYYVFMSMAWFWTWPPFLDSVLWNALYMTACLCSDQTLIRILGFAPVKAVLCNQYIIKYWLSQFRGVNYYIPLYTVQRIAPPVYTIFQSVGQSLNQWASIVMFYYRFILTPVITHVHILHGHPYLSSHHINRAVWRHSC